jgi:hypothetical protein
VKASLNLFINLLLHSIFLFLHRYITVSIHIV